MIQKKEMKTLKLSEQSFCLHICTKNWTGVIPIANNRDYSAFRTLSFVPLCRLHFGSDCNEVFSAFELNWWASKHFREYFFFSHGYPVVLFKFQTCDFWEIRQNSVSPVISTCFFSLAHQAVNILTITRLKIKLKTIFSLRFLHFLGPKIKHYIYKITALKRR